MGVPTDGQSDAADAGLWLPTPGERVTVEYPHRSVGDTFPPVRVGECVARFDDHFTYCCAMTGQMYCVSLADHVPAGVTWRRWTSRDGWPRPKRRK